MLIVKLEDLLISALDRPSPCTDTTEESTISNVYGDPVTEKEPLRIVFGKDYVKKDKY